MSYVEQVKRRATGEIIWYVRTEASVKRGTKMTRLGPFTNREDAEKMLAETKAKTATVAQGIEAYIAHLNRLGRAGRENRLDKSRLYGKRLAELLGEIKMKDLTVTECEDAWLTLLLDKDLAAKTVANHRSFLVSVLQRNIDKIGWNPAKESKIEREVGRRGEDREFFDRDELAKIILWCRTSEPPKRGRDWRLPVLLVCFTGARRAEICGLKAKDVLSNGTVSLMEQLMVVYPEAIGAEDENGNKIKRGYKLESRELKTGKKGQRNVSLPPWLWLQLAAIAGSLDPEDLLFGEANPDRFGQNFARCVLREAGVPHDVGGSKRGLHSIRHSVAMELIATGVTVTEIAGQLGHTTPATTTRSYLHAIKKSSVSPDIIGGMFT
jgi:integrase